LYDHKEYEYKAFNVISREIQKKYGLNHYKYYDALVKLHSRGIKERLFDKAFLEIKGKLPEGWESFVKEIILPIYRCLNVDITPWKEAIAILEQMKNKGVIIVLITNGNLEVQKNKIRLLGIKYLFDKIYISDEFAIPARKPSTVMFEMFLKDFNLRPSSTIHIGDDEKLDGSCVKVGMKFIEIRNKNDWYKVGKALKGYDIKQELPNDI